MPWLARDSIQLWETGLPVIHIMAQARLAFDIKPQRLAWLTRLEVGPWFANTWLKEVIDTPGVRFTKVGTMLSLSSIFSGTMTNLAWRKRSENRVWWILAIELRLSNLAVQELNTSLSLSPLSLPSRLFKQRLKYFLITTKKVIKQNGDCHKDLTYFIGYIDRVPYFHQ